MEHLLTNMKKERGVNHDNVLKLLTFLRDKEKEERQLKEIEDDIKYRYTLSEDLQKSRDNKSE